MMKQPILWDEFPVFRSLEFFSIAETFLVHCSISLFSIAESYTVDDLPVLEAETHSSSGVYIPSEMTFGLALSP